MRTVKHQVAVVIPCYNEADNIAKVLRSFHTARLAKASFRFDLIVVDNNSTDDTAAIAAQAGARVVSEPRKGKGHAMRTGFLNIKRNAEYVVMIDGDNTYRPQEVLRMLEPLANNFCDVVVGSRLGGKINGDAMRTINRGGNWVYTHLVRLIYKVNVTDVLSGYFAWKREVIDKLLPHLHANGFAIEMEMITKLSKMNCGVYSVPISYDPRGGHTQLAPFKDGVRILKMLFRNLRWEDPEKLGGEAEVDA